jgi:hypothetical protein
VQCDKNERYLNEYDNILIICSTYKKDGTRSKVNIEVRTDLGGEGAMPGKISLDKMTEVIEDIIATSGRGEKIRETEFYLGRSFIRGIRYDKVNIDISIVCKKEECDASYAEIRFN